jgi:hypothetical protein
MATSRRKPSNRAFIPCRYAEMSPRTAASMLIMTPRIAVSIRIAADKATNFPNVSVMAMRCALYRNWQCVAQRLDGRAVVAGAFTGPAVSEFRTSGGKSGVRYENWLRRFHGNSTFAGGCGPWRDVCVRSTPVYPDKRPIWGCRRCRKLPFILVIAPAAFTAPHFQEEWANLVAAVKAAGVAIDPGVYNTGVGLPGGGELGEAGQALRVKRQAGHAVGVERETDA